MGRALALAHAGGIDALAELPRSQLDSGPVIVGGIGRGRPQRFGDIVIGVDGFAYGFRLEALAELYRRHGIGGMLSEVDGDFALMLFDGSSGTLHVVRDRFGIKPLYFARVSEGVAVASRLRSLFAVPGINLAPRPEFVALFAGSHYRTFDNAVEKSPYVGIEQLPAGQRLEIRGYQVTCHRWYSLTEQEDLEGTEDELAERYRALLLAGVKQRRSVTRGDAFTLSGGMDSSSVVACAVRDSGRRVHAYSSTYSDPTYDEREEISTVLEDTVEEWHPVEIGNPELGPVLAKMVDANDEPVATATWLAHFQLCRQVGDDGFRTLYGGLGGDELNAGEYEYFFYFFADLAREGHTALLEQEVERWVAYHDHPIFRKSRAVVDDTLARIADLSQPGVCLPDMKRLLRYAHCVRSDWYDLPSFRPVMDHPFSTYLKNRTYQDIFRETAPCCLRAADRQAAAFGLDVVWPFFDRKLVEFMFRIPGTMKIRAGVTKHLLRKAMKGLLPDATRTRIKKTGWNAPAHVWFTGAGADMIRDVIASRTFREAEIYDVPVVERLLVEHEEIVSSGRAQDNHMMFFWQLLNLHVWQRWLAGSTAGL